MRTRIPRNVLDNLMCRTTRDFRTLKRRQIKTLLSALNELRIGCVYLPGYRHIGQLADKVKQLHGLLSAKKWGR